LGWTTSLSWLVATRQRLFHGHVMKIPKKCFCRKISVASWGSSGMGAAGKQHSIIRYANEEALYCYWSRTYRQDNETMEYQGGGFEWLQPSWSGIKCDHKTTIIAVC
jgi:hypothetical protein